MLQALLVAWAAALVFYFEVREGLIRWPWLFRPEGESWFTARNLPDPRLEPTQAFLAEASPYTEIVKSAFRPYNAQWANAPWRELLIASAMIVAYTFIGWMLLSLMRLFVPRGARLCLALAVGCGTVGVAAELLAMAGRLTQPGVMTLWAVLLAAAMICGGWGFVRRHALRDFSAHTRLTASEQTQRANHWYVAAHPWPHEWPARLLVGLYGLLFGIITVLVTLHAVGEPVAYWDALILYVGYARDICLQGGFPQKVVGQVGVGLGANYPHMYELLAAQTAALSGYWSDTFAQLLPPVATTAAMVLVYYTVTELTRQRLVGLAAAVIVRSVPYGLSYSQFASNYSLAILFTAAFIYMACKLVRDGLPGYRDLMLLLAAMAVHINYLMWGLWPVAALAVVAACTVRPRAAADSMRAAEYQSTTSLFSDTGTRDTDWADLPPEPLALHYRPKLLQVLKSRRFWLSVALALVVASPWYIRNIVVTGNPVYAFYSNIFPSKNVNPAVMKSAEQEWLLNGDGLGRVGRTLPEKLRGSWLYFVTGNQHWKLAPFFMAMVLPGFFLWLVGWVASWRSRPRGTSSPPSSAGFYAALVAPAALFCLLWFYAYCVADFYLYQIIIVLPLFGLFAGVLFAFCKSRPARIVLHTLVVLTALAPGVVMGIMGFKLKKTGVYDWMPAPQMNATALRTLFMKPSTYYRMEFGGDMIMLDYVNELPAGTVILTHENRALLLNPALKIVHLDDWEVQAAYEKPAAERVKILDALGVKYYLYVPNEDRHVANGWLGMAELIRLGYYKEEFSAPSVDGGVPGPQRSVIPEGQNVLYKRTTKAP